MSATSPQRQSVPVKAPVPGSLPASRDVSRAERALADMVLVEKAREGDRKAFRALVDLYQESVTLTVVSMLGRSGDVDDAVQEAFIRCYQTLDRFRGEASFATYIKRIAINKSLDILRRRKRFFGRLLSRDDPHQVVVEPATDPQGLEKQERARLVHEAIATLPPKHRAVVVLRMIEGYSTEETAQLLDLPYGTVLSRLSRAQKKLKDVLAPLMR